jgi:hypothetical protein
LNRRQILISVSIFCFYFVLAVALSLARRPWFDEAFFANPALDLVTRGHMGLTIAEPTAGGTFPGTTMYGLHTRVYYSMPLGHLGQAAWYRLAGFGVLRMRLYHILWGLVALASWAFIVRKLMDSWAAGLVAAALIAIDRGFLDAASSGRPDMMSAALGALAVASYLALRERRLGAAALTSQAFLAAAWFTHPIGAVAEFAILVLAIRLDWRRLTVRHVCLAAAPFIIGFGLWGLYISRDPAAFRAQFGDNLAKHESGMNSPLALVVAEVRNRFLANFYLPPYAKGLRSLTVLIPVAYATAVLALLFRKHGPRLLAVMAIVFFMVLGFLEATKPSFYLVHITPLLASCVAVWAWMEWETGKLRQRIASCAVIALAILEIAWIGVACHQNSYRTAYLPAMAFLDQHAGAHASIIGHCELGFHFGFYNNLTDDDALGYYSGKRPDFIVVDDNGYQQSFKGYPSKAPELDRYIRKTLTEDYDQVYSGPVYTIYQRRNRA